MHDLEIDLKKYYNDKALEIDEIALTYKNPSAYKRFFFHSRFESVFGALDPKRGESILELGCGSGYYSKKIVSRKAILTTTDISENYVKQTKKFVGKSGRANYLVADATKLLFNSNSFDKVLFTEVIEHIPNYEKSLKEIKRVLKPGGQLIISTPSRYSPMNIAYNIKRKIKKFTFNEHVHEFTPHEFVELVGKYLEVKRLEFSNILVPYPFDQLFLKTNSRKIIKILKLIEKYGRKNSITKYLGWTMIITAQKKQ